MGDSTAIEWTDATWNPVRGCSRVSEGCRNCYAETMARRFQGSGMPYEGLIARGGQWNGEIMTLPEKLAEPLQWTRPRRIFVNSMSDLFHEQVPESFILAVFRTMADARRHTFQVLTKRPERMHEMLTRWQVDGLTLREGCGVVLPNVWLGVSVEDQATADARLPVLLETPAAVRWVSVEPLLGPVRLARWLRARMLSPGLMDGRALTTAHLTRKLDWVVLGGESGARARPMHPAWARAVRDECLGADIPFLFKQWGEYVPATIEGHLGFASHGRPIGGHFRFCDQSDAPHGDFQLLPTAQLDEVTVAFRFGKARASRLLDGVLHDAYPAVCAPPVTAVAET